jgi:phage tail sheath protein FI
VEFSYPGVYIEEIENGGHAIPGVPTSITAFVGRALRGPVDKARKVTSYEDFRRAYGDLWAESALAYAVRDFYRHGGSTAVIVRVHKPDTDDTATIALGAGRCALNLQAASPGAWGAQLSAAIDDDVCDKTDTTLFNLTVTDDGSGTVEAFRDVSFAPTSTRRVDLVLAQDSNLVVMTGELPTQPQSPFPTTATATNGNDGNPVDADVYTRGANLRLDARGLYALEHTDLVNLIVVPPYTSTGDVDESVLDDTIAYAAERRAVVIIDPVSTWNTADAALAGVTAESFTTSRNAAAYFPRVRQADPLRDNEIATFAPSGAIAGIIARTDATRGVWNAPAGSEATFNGVTELDVPLTDVEIGRLNPAGLNCLRRAPEGDPVIWGARTREGADQLGSEWTYLPVRRTALFLEESLYRGTQWVVFEPNDEPLWAQIRWNMSVFMNTLFHQGAFAGTKPPDAYFVKCDRETTTQDDINRGILNIVVGFAPLKPAEFVVIRLQQMAGQAEGEHVDRDEIEALVERIEPVATWDDLVTAAGHADLLHDIARQATNREPGVTALFTGERGTGKTLAAEVLAADLGLDLYRIDLSAVVSKYIGETEKNLRRVFDAAEEGGAVLLFDEADALFGRRSDVKDSHDRYANIEVDYLLQRMESYRGLAILAASLRSNIDPAFIRRLRFVVHFPVPDA